MSKERLSKLRKWVLVNAYTKTILGELPKDWRQTRKEMSEGYGSGDWRRGYLFKSEILLNFFNLSRSKQTPRNSDERILSNGAYRSALVTLSRSLWVLKDKGFILIEGETEWIGIKLTPKGKAKAESLLNVN